MNKIAKRLFLLVGAIFPIFIGLLHTITHFRELIKPEIKEYLQKEFLLLGQEQALWNTWGIVSFMMGASFIIIGILNLGILNRLKETALLPVAPIVAMLIYQTCVIYVGITFQQDFQTYGGIFGLILIFICLVLSLKLRS